MNWIHFKYFSKGSLNTVALQLAVCLRVACCLKFIGLVHHC